VGTVYFPAERVLEMRRCVERTYREGPARGAEVVPERACAGWFKSTADPAKLLACFPGLRLKSGFVLRAYLYRDGSGNGNGFVWATSRDLPFPEPEACPRVEGVFLSPPRPPGSLENFMEAVEGDGTPWSYLANC